MARNFFLTTLDTLGSDRTLRYYGAANEYGFDYCEAVMDMEASAKYILARFPIDEILVLGTEVLSESGDEKKSTRLKDARALYSRDPGTLTAYDLYRARLAQYIDELSLEQQACDALLPVEEQRQLADFIQSFLEQYSEQETKRLNRLFDELACKRPLFEQFKDALFDAFPDARKNSRLVMRWVRNYLYTQLKPTAKLEALSVNEDVRARYIPADMLDKREYWFDSVLNVSQDVLDGKEEIKLYVSLSGDSAVDDHVVLNTLDILSSTPGSNVHLKKIYKVSEPAGGLTGSIKDNTVVSFTTNLVAAAHAFLNYSKTDMLVSFWENSGQQDERISRLIYAARHVDVGISMCNIPEVQKGIQLLRKLFHDERSWTEDGDYGLLFGVIAGCIQADYKPLLEDDELSFIKLIKWAYGHQLYQQVLTLVESHAPTNLVKTGIFYYCDDEERAPEIIDILAQQRLGMKPYEYYKLDDIDHYFVKNYDRESVRLSGSRGEDRNLTYAALRAQSIENRDPAKIGGHTACDSIETVQNVLYAYFHLGFVRNKISHADSDAMAEQRLIVSDRDISSAMVLMRESIEYFILSYEKALAEVEGKSPKIVAISPNDVRNAADRMKRTRPPEDRTQSPRRK